MIGAAGGICSSGLVGIGVGSPSDAAPAVVPGTATSAFSWADATRLVPVISRVISSVTMSAKAVYRPPVPARSWANLRAARRSSTL